MPSVASDWESEVLRKLQGRPCGIPNAQMNNLPHFLRNAEHYLRRSAALSENMFRLSLDFARLCPRDGEFDEILMARYARVLARMRAQGQEPLITLHHFTLPKHLTEMDQDGNIHAGAWEHPDVIRHFRFYVRNVTKFLTDPRNINAALTEVSSIKDVWPKIASEGLTRYFMTINEPTGFLYNGYIIGLFPPYKKRSLVSAKKVLERLVDAHSAALQEIKETYGTRGRQSYVGVGYNRQYFPGVLGRIVQELDEYCTSRFERKSNNSDFVGLHYYFRKKLPLFPSKKALLEYSDQPTFGDIYPPGIVEVLKQMHATYPRKPICITEFGFSDKHDLRRPFWIVETMNYILRACRMGIPIMGVLLWTLANNFEWDLGMSQKFGLFSESELSEPLLPSKNGIRSWEIWRALACALRTPTQEHLQELQRCYAIAREQYRMSGGKYRV